MGALRGYAAAAVGTALVTVAIGLLSSGSPRSSLAMLYLLVVLGAATAFGRGPAIAAALLAFLAFNFFFVEPIHSFVVSDPDEWLNLLLLLVTAVVTGSLAAELRRRAEQAHLREREALLLHALTGLVYADDPPARALPAVAERLRQELGAAWVEVRPAGDDGAAPEPVRAGTTAADGPVVDEPLRAGEHALGVLRVGLRGRARRLTHEEERLVSAVAAQVGLALDRARLRTAATQAEVLRQSDELKTALLGSVSHDLRTPLAAIKAAAGSVLADGAWSGEEGQSAAHRIESEVDRLNRIVGNLLEASRIESGALHPNKELYPLADLVEGVARRLARSGASHPIVVEIPADLPPVPLDYVQIEQVVTNLVENARTHTPPATQIRVSARLADGAVEVTVADAGPGIPAEALPRVFDKFFRAAGPRTRGTGLGLTVARGLVEAHGGRIWAESTPGQGAAFHFTLPVGS